jgi:hypothetical protein
MDKYLKRLNKKMETGFGWVLFIGKFLIILFFSLGGYFLLFRQFKKEKDEKRKFFILVVAVFSLAIMAVSVPFGAEISLRYFILSAFVPYVILGFWINKLEESQFSLKNIIIIFIAGGLIFYNLFFNLEIFRLKYENIPGNMIDGTMKQTEKIAEYIINEARPYKKIQLAGQNVYLGRFFNRISYFTLPQKFEIIYSDKKSEISDNLPLFVAVDEMSGECRPGMFYKYGEVEKCQRIYDVTIIKIKDISQ